MRPYRSAIEWAHHQDMDAIDANDVASHWHEHHLDAVGDANENTLRSGAVCFFNIAEAAGLGVMTPGRGGKPTRLAIDKTQLTAFVEAGPSDPPWESAEETDPDTEGSDGDDDATGETKPGEKPPESAPQVSEPLRVFISHGSNDEVVEQIEVILDVASIEAEVAEAEETMAIPAPENVLNSMKAK